MSRFVLCAVLACCLVVVQAADHTLPSNNDNGWVFAEIVEPTEAPVLAEVEATRKAATHAAPDAQQQQQQAPTMQQAYPAGGQQPFYGYYGSVVKPLIPCLLACFHRSACLNPWFSPTHNQRGRAVGLRLVVFGFGPFVVAFFPCLF